jgi:hypothetical protein
VLRFDALLPAAAARRGAPGVEFLHDVLHGAPQGSGIRRSGISVQVSDIRFSLIPDG